MIRKLGIIIARVLALTVALAILLVCAVFGWLYFYTADLPDRAQERRNQVVDRMMRSGAITAEEAEQAKNSPLNLVKRP